MVTTGAGPSISTRGIIEPVTVTVCSFAAFFWSADCVSDCALDDDCCVGD